MIYSTFKDLYIIAGILCKLIMRWGIFFIVHFILFTSMFYCIISYDMKHKQRFKNILKF
jgi:hypothetical protein